MAPTCATSTTDAADARPPRGESGFTLIELLVTMALVAVGVLAVITTFDYSRRLVTTAEKSEVASHYAEAEMERLASVPYANLALPAPLSASASPSDPDYYVQSGGTAYQWDQGATGPKSDNLVIDPVAAQVTHVSAWTDAQSRLSGSIYRYVTTVPGTNGDQKRVTIAVTVAGADLSKPTLMSSIFSNRKAGTG